MAREGGSHVTPHHGWSFSTWLICPSKGGGIMRKHLGQGKKWWPGMTPLHLFGCLNTTPALTQNFQHSFPWCFPVCRHRLWGQRHGGQAGATREVTDSSRDASFGVAAKQKVIFRCLDKVHPISTHFYDLFPAC